QPEARTLPRGGRGGLTVGHRLPLGSAPPRIVVPPARGPGGPSAQRPGSSSATPSRAAPTTAQASGVTSQIRRLSRATDQRTVRRPRATPAPTTLEASAWLVETGDSSPNTPSDIVSAAEDSAASPCAAVRSVSR